MGSIIVSANRHVHEYDQKVYVSEENQQAEVCRDPLSSGELSKRLLDLGVLVQSTRGTDLTSLKHCQPWGSRYNFTSSRQTPVANHGNAPFCARESLSCEKYGDNFGMSNMATLDAASNGGLPRPSCPYCACFSGQ